MLNVALRPRLAVLLLAGALVASLTGCGGKEAASAPAPAAQSSTTPSSSPTATATPTPNGAGGKYGELTLVVRRPAKAKANTSAALASFQAVHESFAAMAANGQKAPAEMSDVATPEVISWLSGLLDPQRKLKEQAGGTLTIRVTEAQASTRVAVVQACFDQTKLVMIRPNGSRYVDATVKENPTMAIRATVTSLVGKWKVTEYSLGDKC